MISLIVLGVLGGILAIILYFVAQKFKVEENPLIDEVEACLAGANCGGCGYAGCRNFAEACVKAASEKQSLAGLNCPSSDMQKVADVLKLTVEAAEPMIAVLSPTPYMQAKAAAQKAVSDLATVSKNVRLMPFTSTRRPDYLKSTKKSASAAAPAPRHVRVASSKYALVARTTVAFTCAVRIPTRGPSL